MTKPKLSVETGQVQYSAGNATTHKNGEVSSRYKKSPHQGMDI